MEVIVEKAIEYPVKLRLRLIIAIEGPQSTAQLANAQSIKCLGMTSGIATCHPGL